MTNKLTKYGLASYYNAEKNNIKLAVNKTSMTLIYKALRFAKENRQAVKEVYTGARFVIITLK